MIKFSSIRFSIIRHFFGIAVMGSLVFFVGMQLYLIEYPKTYFSTKNILIMTIFLFVLMALLSLYGGYRSSRVFIGRLDGLLSFVSILRRGKYSERAEIAVQDEVGLIFEELNQLAIYIQDQVRSLQRLADEKSTLAEQAHQAAIMEERQRFARDLHDSVSQQLFALGMLSSTARRTVVQDPEKAEILIKQIADISTKAQAEMRALLLHLRPIDLKGDSLRAGLIKLVSELKEKVHLQIDCKIEEINGLSKGIEEHIFRIVQEALSNILRHSLATKIRIHLEAINNQLHLYISDNGRGFEMERQAMTSYGLQTMRERCEELGGVFQLRSKQDEGTYIDIKIPL